MLNRLLCLLNLQKKIHTIEPDKATLKKFRKRYANFRKLLDANANLAELMADIEVKLSGNTLFGTVYINKMTEKALYLTKRMVTSLQIMSSGKHLKLTHSIEQIKSNLSDILGEQKYKSTCSEITFPLSALDLSFIDCVGGKSANLGEMANKARVPVPRGFAITTNAYHIFMQHQNLENIILEKLKDFNIEQRDELLNVLQEIRELIENAPLPPELELAFDQAWDNCFAKDDIKIAVRSSALGTVNTITMHPQ